MSQKNTPRAPKWAPEEEARLRDLWASGLTPAEIAQRLDRTHSMVLGKAFRLNLPTKLKCARLRKGEQALRDKQAEQAALASGLPPRGCLWPIGDPAKPDYHTCNAARGAKRVYCDHHHAIAYRPMTDWEARL